MSYTAGKLKETLGDLRLPVLKESGLIPPEHIPAFDDYKRTYEPGRAPHWKHPDRDAEHYYNSKTYVEKVVPLVSQQVSAAVHSGNESVMSYLQGIDSERVDMRHGPNIDALVGLWSPEDSDDMLNLVIYAPLPPEGPTGVGKTDFGYLCLEAGQRAYPGLSIASNNTSDRFEDVQAWSELEDWLEDTGGPKAFLWDEAAQVLQYADMSAGKALSQLIKLLRKYNCHLIVIGHTGKDIPKDVRRMVLLARKESKKKATVGVGLDETNDGDMTVNNVMFRMSGIPPTRIGYDSTGDTGSFEFDMGDDGDADDDDSEDEPEETPVVTCRGEKADGGDCGSNVSHHSGYCWQHRDQWDGEPDPRLSDGA